MKYLSKTKKPAETRDLEKTYNRYSSYRYIDLPSGEELSPEI